MTSNGPSAPSELAKLTVPQLKALCKERRITGYSKLAKAALLQRLAGVAVPTEPTSPSSDQASRGATIEPLEKVQDQAYTDPSAAHREDNAAHRSVQLSTAGNTEPTHASAAKVLPIELSNSSQIHTPANTTRTQKTSGTKRPAHIDISVLPKRTRASIEPAANASDGRSTFQAPELPTRPERSHGSVSTLAEQPSETAKHSAVPRQIAGGPVRFKPLAVSRPRPAEPDQGSREPPREVNSLQVTTFRATPPVLSQISFPPKASERKWVYRWAIILSALSGRDRQTCRLVSRTFRYAVYLSATHILSRKYPGRRLDSIFEQHPKNMTNLWPYLRFRTTEVSERRLAFRQSFLGQFTASIGYDPLTERLWTSPDDEKQVEVALRFVLTRMWFATSVGGYGHDASKWSRCVIRDVVEVVKDEVWQVFAQNGVTGQSWSYYVLEATCEVIGQSPSSQGGDCLRADWTAWISRRSLAPTGGECSLLKCVKWSNGEDYHRGISKAWLRRVQGQDADGIAKRRVAERYVLASVVANGISGKWMSTSAMAQEFAGLPGSDASRTKERPASMVNMYLATHHHIESVHFTTCKGEALHNAVAVVQTPGREYYVLRENGMEVGCEEEGIARVWQQILKCDERGRVQSHSVC